MVLLSNGYNITVYICLHIAFTLSNKYLFLVLLTVLRDLLLKSGLHLDLFLTLVRSNLALKREIQL